MVKKEYENVTIKTVLFCESDIVTASSVIFDGEGENFGSVNKSWYGGTD